MIGMIALYLCVAKRKLSMIQSFLNRINGFRESTMVESEDFDEGAWMCRFCVSKVEVVGA